MAFYKISKAIAEQIGKMEYAPGKAFDPFVNEQKDGTYLVSSEMFTILKDNPKFKEVDWTKLNQIEKIQIDSKVSNIK